MISCNYMNSETKQTYFVQCRTFFSDMKRLLTTPSPMVFLTELREEPLRQRHAGMTGIFATSKNLGELLGRLIAAQEEITPEQVTVAYIEEQRQKRFYPNTRYNLGSDSGERICTREELDAIERQVDKALERILNPAIVAEPALAALYF